MLEWCSTISLALARIEIADSTKTLAIKISYAIVGVLSHEMNVLHKHKEAALLLLVGGLNVFTPPFIVRSVNHWKNFRTQWQTGLDVKCKQSVVPIPSVLVGVESVSETFYQVLSVKENVKLCSYATILAPKIINKHLPFFHVFPAYGLCL